jgi:hypothetical protein
MAPEDREGEPAGETRPEGRLWTELEPGIWVPLRLIPEFVAALVRQCRSLLRRG